MRRMLVPEAKIKSKVADDVSIVPLSELEPYIENGKVIFQTIVSDLPKIQAHGTLISIGLEDGNEGINYHIRNGAVVTLNIDGDEIRLYGDFYTNNDDGTPYDYLYFDRYDLGDLSIVAETNISFDLYVIKN